MDARRIACAILWCAAGSAAVASASPLHEIGHTPITDAVCSNVVVHANSAIAASLRGDDSLARAIAKLRSANFEDDSPGKRAALGELARAADEIGDSATRGASESRRLLALVGDAPADHAPGLRAFATALESALDRQGKVSVDIGAFVASFEDRDLRGVTSADSAEPVRLANRASASPPPPRQAFVGRSTAPSTLARNLANELERRLGEIERDESRAAERAEIAVTGC